MDIRKKRTRRRIIIHPSKDITGLEGNELVGKKIVPVYNWQYSCI